MEDLWHYRGRACRALFSPQTSRPKNFNANNAVLYQMEREFQIGSQKSTKRQKAQKRFLSGALGFLL
jgi:hypothetical protein